jgi:hypothetical protein
METVVRINDNEVTVDGVVYQRVTNHKPTQEEFDKVFIDLIEEGKNNVRFINGTYRFELSNNKGKWMFDISYDPEDPHFWFSMDRVYMILKDKFNLEYPEIQRYMRNILDNDLKLKEVVPVVGSLSYRVELDNDLKLREVVPH